MALALIDKSTKETVIALQIFIIVRILYFVAYLFLITWLEAVFGGQAQFVFFIYMQSQLAQLRLKYLNHKN